MVTMRLTYFIDIPVYFTLIMIYLQLYTKLLLLPLSCFQYHNLPFYIMYS